MPSNRVGGEPVTLKSHLLLTTTQFVAVSHVTDEETDAQRLFFPLALEYPLALVEMQIFGSTPDLRICLR